jgi:cell division transport system permease protein
VASYEFVSAEQAWEDFKEIYFEGKEDLADGYAEDNPLANDANYQIYLNDVSMQQSLVDYLETLDGVREVNQSEVAANTLTDFNSLIGYISVAIIIILLAVSIFLISNTVTVGISVRREEIGIMKLIGATDYFVRAPFLIEGIMIGLIGSVVPLIILFFLYKRIVVYITERFYFLSDMMNFLPVQTVFRVLIPVSIILGVGIGYVGSRLTIHKHLKV